MKIYVINLAKNQERMAKMDVQLKSLHVNYERYEAVFGKNIPENEIKSLYNPFAWWCTQGYPIRRGQLGCALSHLNLYRKFLASDELCCCIMEDDLAIDSKLLHVLEYIEGIIGTWKPRAVLLHKHFSGAQPIGDQVQVVKIAYERCSDAYVINRRGAEVLLSVNFPIKRPCDHWSAFARKGKLELFQAFPTTCSQVWDADYKSDVYVGECVDVTKMGSLDVIIWKCKRIVGKLLSFVCGL